VPHWNPGSAVARGFPGGVVLPAESTTVVSIDIDRSGRVAAELVRGSGVEALDHEALRAVKAARQFAAPPTGLLDESGHVRVLFSFTLETSGKRLMFHGPDDRAVRDLFRNPIRRW
jgi:TonB family protein